MMKQIKKLTQNDVLLIVIGVVLLAVGFFAGKHIYKCKPAAVNTYRYDSLMMEHRHTIDSFSWVNARLKRDNLTLDSTVATLEEKRYNNQQKTQQDYEKINTAPDSMQHDIFCELLSRMRQYLPEGN